MNRPATPRQTRSLQNGMLADQRARQAVPRRRLPRLPGLGPRVCRVRAVCREGFFNRHGPKPLRVVPLFFGKRRAANFFAARFFFLKKKKKGCRMRDTLSFRSAEESVPDVNETWAVLLQHYGQPNSETLEEATEINIEAFLKPNGPGVKYLNGALRYLPKLKRMYTSALTANVTANLAGTSLPSLSERVESTTESTPASSEETWGGFLLALYAAYNGAYDVPEKAFAEFPFTTLQVPAGFKSIGREAFQRCQNLQKVELPEGIERIEFKAFEGCISLTSIKFPASLEKVGGFAFTASGIESVHFPAESGVKVIAEGTFSHCQQLKEVRLPAGLEIIGNAFIECHLLETITSEGTTNKLPASLRAVKRRAFHGCKSLTKVDLKATQLTIIKEMTFLNCNLVEVELPPSLESIGEAAFANCQQLTSINFPETLQTIEEEAFHGCSSLTKVDLKATQLTIISNKTFLNCNLVEVELPPSLQSIGEQAFANCQKLTSINFPKTLQTIEEEAFHGCSSLTKVDLKATQLTIISNKTFLNCNLVEVELPPSLQSIGEQAFANCQKLTSINFPKTLQTIKKEAFLNCKGVEQLVMPASLQEIGRRAFKRCGIEYVQFPAESGLQAVENQAFEECASLKNVDLAATKLKIISEETFKNCEKLEKVILPQNLTEIKKDAFYHCIKLVSIEWPPTLRSIGDGAFQMCPLPEEQWLSAAAEIKIGDHAFGPGPVLVGSAPLADAPADALLTEARRIEPASDAAAPRSTLSWKEGAAIAGGVAGGGLAWVTVQGAKALLDQNRAKKKSGPKKR